MYNFIPRPPTQTLSRSLEKSQPPDFILQLWRKLAFLHGCEIKSGQEAWVPCTQASCPGRVGSKLLLLCVKHMHEQNTGNIPSLWQSLSHCPAVPLPPAQEGPACTPPHHSLVPVYPVGPHLCSVCVYEGMRGGGREMW